jgi:hypothetical protein
MNSDPVGNRCWSFRIASFVFAFCLVLCASAGAQDTCPEADSSGSTPADAAINNCLSRSLWVTLPGGTYLITNTVHVGQSNAEFSSVPGQTASLVAALSFPGTILYAGGGANYFNVHDIRIDGQHGFGRDSCPSGANLSADGTGWTVANMRSDNSPCANTAIGGDYFSFHDNFLWHSGSVGGPVGDGLDVFLGVGGEVYNNTIGESTDIGLIMWGGQGRHVHDNHIDNTYYYGLAGFNVGSQGQGVPGDHTGSVYERNSVTSAYNMLGIGILLGAHPWSSAPGDDVTNAGTVINNSSSGAVINLMVEGIANIQNMYGNTTSNHQGTHGVGTNCNDPTGGQDPRYEYTAWHFSGPIQNGPYGLQADNVVGLPNACVPQ